MKILFTAEYDPSMKEQIEELGEVHMTGWAVGEPIMKEEDMIKLMGDVDFASAEPVAGAITPVPGGVGPMTIAMLMQNAILAAEKRHG